MKKILFALVLVAGPVYAQNPCTGSVTDLDRNPTKVAMTLSELTATWPDGTPRVVSVELQYRKQGDAVTVPAVATVNIPKAQFTAVANAMDCFQANFVAPAQLQIGQTYVTYARALGSGTTVSTVSPVSNPFFLDGAPSAPGAIRMVRAVFDILLNRSRDLADRFFGSSPSSRPRAGR